MNYLAICFVRFGRLNKRYKRVEYEITSKDTDEATETAINMIKKQYPEHVFFIARIYKNEG